MTPATAPGLPQGPRRSSFSLFDPALLRAGDRRLPCPSSIPASQWRNPVMFVVCVGSIVTTVLWIQALVGQGEAPPWFVFADRL